MDYVTTLFNGMVWNIREPILSRYLETEFTDKFFEDGTLQLSSFQAFREHPDEQRSDAYEGSGSQRIIAPNGGHSLLVLNSQPAYILCACAIQGKDLSASFSTTDGFQIFNPLRFAECISRHVPGFVGGFQGLCSYSDGLLEKRTSRTITPPEEGEDPEEWSTEYDKWVSREIIDSFFLKRLRYAHQFEYRFIWLSDTDYGKFLRIKCPEAIDVCCRLFSSDGSYSNKP